MPLMVKIRLTLVCVVAVAVVAGIVGVFVFLNAGAAEARKREEAACVPAREKVQRQAEKAQDAVALIASAEHPQTDPETGFLVQEDELNERVADGLTKSREATTTEYTLVSDNFQCFDSGMVRHARDWPAVVEDYDDAEMAHWNCSYDGEFLSVQRLPVRAGPDRQCTWEQLWQAGAYSG
ncbi:hypothetical protein ACWD4L_20495 [Streptomyces sp. NPDC002596]